MKGIKGSVLEQDACGVRHLYKAKSPESAWRHTTERRRRWFVSRFALSSEIRKALGRKVLERRPCTCGDTRCRLNYILGPELPLIDLPKRCPGIFKRLVARALKRA